jgi:hypothetical protein
MKEANPNIITFTKYTMEGSPSTLWVANFSHMKYTSQLCTDGCLCGLVVRVPGYRSRGPGLTPRATRFSEK